MTANQHAMAERKEKLGNRSGWLHINNAGPNLPMRRRQKVLTEDLVMRDPSESPRSIRKKVKGSEK